MTLTYIGKKEWLPLHLWHSKRCIMESKWGLKLAVRPKEKCRLRLYRAASRSCTIHDASYIKFIKLSASSVEDIYQFLQGCLDPTGFPITNESFVSRRRIGRQLFYKYQEYPRSVICPVEFIWNFPDDNMLRCQLIIMVHPAGFDEVMNVLKLMKRDFSSLVEIENISGRFGRFDFNGQRSTDILQHVLPKFDESGDSLSKWTTFSKLSGISPSALEPGYLIDIDIKNCKKR